MNKIVSVRVSPVFKVAAMLLAACSPPPAPVSDASSSDAAPDVAAREDSSIDGSPQLDASPEAAVELDSSRDALAADVVDDGALPSDAADAGSSDAGNAASDAASDGARDVSVDAAPDVVTGPWYGFRECAAPPDTAAVVEPAFAVPISNINSVRDVSFDGRGNLLLAARDAASSAAIVVSISSTGVPRELARSSSVITGARYLVDGSLILSGSFPGGAGLVTAVQLRDSAGIVRGQSDYAGGFPWGALPLASGGFVVLDSVGSALFQFAAPPLPAVFPSAVSESMAVGPVLNSPRGAALSADGEHLFVASQTNGFVFEYTLTAGAIDGNSRRVYASLGAGADPRSVAFDECGNLYVSATSSVGGSPSGVIYRVRARGGSPTAVATLSLVDPFRVIAFGQGPGFSNTNLYVADSSASVIRVVRVGIPGQRVVVPR